MNISKYLVSFLLISCISSAITGCSQSSPGVTSATTPSSVEPVKAPEVYDVICFQAMGLGVSRTMCDPEQTYKILRSSKITVSLKKETSVQQGNYTVANYNYSLDRKREQITASEMESLASQGANVYTMYYHRMATWGEDKNLIEVQLYNKDLGNFKMFDQSSSPVVFETGDTEVRVELPPRKEGLLGDMQAVQNGGMYRRKIKETTQPADGTVGGNKVDTTKSADETTSSDKPSPDTAIISHYRSIDNKELEKSWSNLSPSFKGSNLTKGFNEYTEWWNSVDKVYIGNVEVVKVSDTSSVVKADLSYKLRSGRIMNDKKKYISLVWTDGKWLINEKSEVL
jgi:hypothetical protein